MHFLYFTSILQDCCRILHPNNPMIDRELCPPESRLQLQRWLTCIAIVSFDVDEGQKIDLIVPHVNLSKESEKQIAMLSFPDSNSFSDHENTFKYTFKASNGLFGYTCFKQKKDPTNPRGFSQRSLVILTELPFVYFFEKMAEFVVFKTFASTDHKELAGIFLDLCQQISKWPDPSPRAAYILPILQYELEIQIPNYLHAKEKSHSIYGRKMEETLLSAELTESNKEFNLKNILTQQQMLKHGPFQEIELGQVFLNCKEGLWAFWECIMLNKSVLLLGDNPQQVSHGVLGGISLIYPFQYCANFNPYITVYDPNLETLAKAHRDWLLGGTNPVFSKFFKPQVTVIISLSSGSTYRCPKHLKPLKELIIQSKSEEQRAINEAAIHKYFYQLSKAVMTIFDVFLGEQTNNLKFFHEADFLRKIKERKDLLGLENIFSSKRHALAFLESFIQSSNFDRYLTNKNAIKAKK